jgi:hypothetical protein
MIKNFYQFGALRDGELRDFEVTNNIKLPEDYKKFLIEFNGGEPVPNGNEDPSTVVSYILGMHNGDYHASLYKHIDIFKNRVPVGTFPIASDVFGNIFIMSVDPGSYGHIYFWEYEGEPEHQDGHFVGNCSFVSYTFTEFLENLT